MCCRNWGKAIFLAIICLAVLPGPPLGEEQTAAQPTADAVEAVIEETPAAAGSPATAAPVEEAEEIPQIDVLAHKEKAATSSVVTKEDIRNGPYMNLPGYLEELSGINMSRRSYLGVRNHQMNLQGFDESRYQVYMNGRTWKGAGVKGGFYVDWSTITTLDLEPLEVIRGGMSAEYPNTWAA